MLHINRIVWVLTVPSQIGHGVLSTNMFILVFLSHIITENDVRVSVLLGVSLSEPHLVNIAAALSVCIIYISVRPPHVTTD